MQLRDNPIKRIDPPLGSTLLFKPIVIHED